MARTLRELTSSAALAAVGLTMAFAALASGCSGLNAAGTCAPDSDGICENPTPGVDAGVSDAGRTPPPEPPPAPPSDAGPASTDGGQPPGSLEDGAFCLDGIDNDRDTLSDCSDEADCGGASACCADNGACCGPAMPAVVLDFVAACALDGPVSECASVREIGSIVSAVGTHASPGGEIVRGLSVGGDLRRDNGVVVPTELSFDGTLALRAELHALAATCTATGTCAESLTVGLAHDAAASGIEPWVSLTVSLDLLRIVLAVDGRVLDTEPLGAMDGAVSLSLRIDADGTIAASAGATLLEGRVTSTPARVYAAVWGRSANVPSSRMFVRSLGLDRSTCDRPRAMTTGQTFTLQGGASLGSAGSPSLASDALGDMRAGVVVIDGTVRGGRYDITDGRRTLELGAEPWFVAPAGETVTSADLVHVASDAAAPWWLLASLETLDGAGSRVVLARSATPGGVSIDVSDIEIRGSDAMGTERIGGIDALVRGTQLLIVSTLATPSGDVIASSSLDVASRLVTPHGIIVQPSESSDGFDHDGVGAPSLVEYRGLLHLFYAGRRGTSTSIGYVFSIDGRYWRRYESGPVVSPSGNVLALTDPEAIFFPDDSDTPGTSGTLEIVYVTNDGARRRLALARRSVFVGSL